MINKPLPLNRDYNMDPTNEARKRRGLKIMGLHQGRGLGLGDTDLEVVDYERHRVF